MKKFHTKFMSVVLIAALMTGCAPKLAVKYDVTPGPKDITEFDQHKLGIMVFEDDRPQDEKEGMSGDDRFEKPVPDMLADLMVTHFDANQKNKGNVVRIDQSIKDIDDATLSRLKKEGLAEYVLLGDIRHYNAAIHDEHAVARSVGSFLAGFTVVGMVFLPLIVSGDIDLNSDIALDDVLLVKLDGPQILWKGKVNSTMKKENPFVTATAQKVVDVHGENTKKALQNLYNNMMLSYELNFPQKFSVEDSKKILSYIKINGSLSGLAY